MSAPLSPLRPPHTTLHVLPRRKSIFHAFVPPEPVWEQWQPAPSVAGRVRLKPALQVVSCPPASSTSTSSPLPPYLLRATRAVGHARGAGSGHQWADARAGKWPRLGQRGAAQGRERLAEGPRHLKLGDAQLRQGRTAGWRGLRGKNSGDARRVRLGKRANPSPSLLSSVSVKTHLTLLRLTLQLCAAPP